MGSMPDRFFSTPTAGVYFGIFRVDRPPFEDPRLRQAVNLAIDRAQLVKIRGGEIAASPWSQILPANLLADEPVDVYPATPDVEGANDSSQAPVSTRRSSSRS